MTTISWLVVVLSILLFSVGIALYRSQRTNCLLQTKEREAREGGDRLLQTIHQSRATLAHLSGECAALRTQLDAIMHAVVRIPLPDDIHSCCAQGAVYLPRTAYGGNGRIAVTIPGISRCVYMIHGDPLKQTAEDRARIAHALRSSKEARAELGLRIF